MTPPSPRRRIGLWIPLVCGLVAIAVRLPARPQPEAAAPWISGSLALQGLRVETDSGPIRSDLVVTLPLATAQNLGYAATRIARGGKALSRVAWIRGQEPFSRSLLWGLWVLAAAGGAVLGSRLRPGGWGLLCGIAIAIVPIGIAGTARLDGWALAAPLALGALAARPVWWGAFLWGGTLSLTPVGFLLAASTLAAGGRSQRLAILLAVPLWFALDPSRLTDPETAVRELLPALRISGWPGVGDGPAGRLLTVSWTPWITAALLGGIGAVATIRDSRLRPASIGVALLWWVPALLGARRPDAIGLISPIALLLAERGAEETVRRAARGRGVLVAAMAPLLLVPLAIGASRIVRSETTRMIRAGEIERNLVELVGARGLLARDPATPIPPDSIPSFPFPTHVDRPEIWDFAYWPGWYGPFTHILLRASTLHRLEEAAPNRPGARALVLGLSSYADAVAVLGDPASDPGALVLFRLRPGPPWEPVSRAELWGGLKGGKTEARFLGDLAAFLAGRGHPARAIELLRLGLRWDESSPQLWNNLGVTFLVLGEPNEAADAVTRGLAYDPSSVELRYTLAQAYLDGKLPARAIHELQRVLTARPSFARAHYDLARAASELKRWPLVVRALEAYLATEPNPPDRAQILDALEEARRLAEGAP